MLRLWADNCELAARSNCERGAAERLAPPSSSNSSRRVNENRDRVVGADAHTGPRVGPTGHISRAETNVG